MKKSVIVIVLLASAQSYAASTYLSVGESINVDGNNIICGEVRPQPRTHSECINDAVNAYRYTPRRSVQERFAQACYAVNYDSSCFEALKQSYKYTADDDDIVGWINSCTSN